MQDNAKLITEIAEIVLACDGSRVIQEVRIGQGSWRNELLLFIKPEVFMIEEADRKQRLLDLVFRKIRCFDAKVDGIIVLGGRILDQMEIMSRHYGYINRLSRTASKMLGGADREQIARVVGVPIDEYDVLGGHEYLSQYADEDSSDLDRLWFAKKSTRLRSGFYVRSVIKNGRNVVLVNGFHPAQLEHFTEPSHRIVLILIHSNSHWAVLRNQMVGATFPEEAAPESIRRTLHAQAQYFGFEAVSIANNAVHLSAGPFEAMFEIVNFFGRTLGLEPEQNPPLVLRRMVEEGIDIEQALSTLENPAITSPVGTIDLFSATEDMDTDSAINFWKQSFRYRLDVADGTSDDSIER